MVRGAIWLDGCSDLVILDRDEESKGVSGAGRGSVRSTGKGWGSRRSQGVRELETGRSNSEHELTMEEGLW